MAILGAATAGTGAAAGASAASSAAAAGAASSAAAAGAASASAAAAGSAAAGTAAASAGAAAAGAAGAAAAGSATALSSAQLAALGLSAVSSLVSGIEQSKQQSAQSDLATRNAAVARENAQASFNVGIAKEEQVRRNSAQQLGAQTAAAGESGFVSNSGSMLNEQVQSAGAADLDALQTRYQGLLQGQAYQDQATNDDYEAAVLKSNSSNSLTSGIIGAGTAALMGYSQFARLGAATGLQSTTLGVK